VNQRGGERAVAVPPKITPFSFRSDLHLGERVGVQCVVGKGDPPLEIRWLKDERPLTASDGVLVRALDQFTSVLSIGALARDLGGNYTCVARNPAAAAAHSALLHVNGRLMSDSCFSTAGDIAVLVRGAVRGRADAGHVQRQARRPAPHDLVAQGWPAARAGGCPAWLDYC